MPTRCSVAVDDRLAQVGRVLGADHDVAELARARRASPRSSIGNESTSVGSALPRCSRVELGDARGVDELDRDVPVVDVGRRQRERDEPLDLGVRAARRATKSAPMTSTSSALDRRRLGATAVALGGAQLRRRALGELAVGLDDPLDEAVADDVLAAEAHEVDALDLLEDVGDDDETRPLLARKVDLRDVAR